jgi:hypothetical protein
VLTFSSPKAMSADVFRGVLAIIALAAACGGSSPPPPPPDAEGPNHLVATPESVGVAPSQSTLINFHLLDDRDAPLADRIIQFAIVDDPAVAGDEARGSTLSFDRGVTDESGGATLQVIAGPEPTMFRVRASAARAPDLEVLVRVDMARYAPVELAPVVVDATASHPEITTAQLSLLEDTTCASVHFPDVPKGLLGVRTVPIDVPVLYSAVITTKNHAAVAVGLDATGTARAAGCVDVSGSILVVEAPVRVLLPVHLLRLDPAGRYAATSHLIFPTPPAGATQIGEAWGDFALCPRDPARLWLDCTIDALHTDASDPSDCRPAADEGLVGNKLLQRRGVPLAMPPGGRCRDKMDGAGRPSHEALVDALFPAERPPLLAGLGALAGEARLLLDSVQLQSTLMVTPTSTLNRYQIQHQLSTVEFPRSARRVVVDLGQMGAPVIAARFVPGTLGTDLAVGSHSFTLRLGMAAWQAFTVACLRPRGAGGDVASFTAAVFGLAARDDHGTALTGCAALDAALCPDVGEARGCLMAACTEGLAALGRRLVAGFDALDGDGLDLVLGGTVPVLDRNGDGRTDALGMVTPSGASAPGLWSGEVRGRGGSSTFTGIWTADLTP